MLSRNFGGATLEGDIGRSIRDEELIFGGVLGHEVSNPKSLSLLEEEFGRRNDGRLSKERSAAMIGAT